VPLLTAVSVNVPLLPATARLGVACMVARALAAAAVAVSPAAIALAIDTPPTRNGMTPGAVAVPAKAIETGRRDRVRLLVPTRKTGRGGVVCG
jgi:hypothetical protein